MSATPLTAAAPPPRLAALTSLRFFAVVAIVVGHTQGCFGIPLNFMEPFNQCQAVSFFFVLSGFILTWVYPALDGPAVKTFLLARFARIWPAHMAALLLLLLLFAPDERFLTETTRWWMVLANLSLTHAWIPFQACGYHFNAVSWSISTEAFFYLCFPLLIYRWRQTWWLKLLLAAGLTAGMITFCNVAHIQDGPGPLRDGVSVHVLIYNHPVTRLFEFVLGMTMLLLFQALRPRVRLRLTAGTVLEGTTVILTVLLMYYSGRVSMAVQRAFPSLGEPGVLWLFPSGLCAPLFGWLIVVMGLNRGLLSRGLSHPFLVLLGEISYSVYLLHYMLIMVYVNHQQALAWIPDPLKLLLYWGLVLLASYLMWRFVEKPCRKLLRSLRPQTGQPQAVPPGAGVPGCVTDGPTSNSRT
ncbi:MAG: acyltransferase [bacterium]